MILRYENKLQVSKQINLTRIELLSFLNSFYPTPFLKKHLHALIKYLRIFSNARLALSSLKLYLNHIFQLCHFQNKKYFYDQVLKYQFTIQRFRNRLFQKAKYTKGIHKSMSTTVSCLFLYCVGLILYFKSKKRKQFFQRIISNMKKKLQSVDNTRLK